MADVTWVKIAVDMFDNRKIKYLRTLPEGNNIVLIWVMLLSMAGRCNADGLIFLTENIPYTAKALANELGFEENIVQLALTVFEQLNMIVVNGEYFAVAGWQEYQNIEGMEKIRAQTRERVAKHRANQKLLLCNVTSNATVTDGNATDKEQEKDLEKDIIYISCKNTPSKSEIKKFFDKIWSLYPNKKGKGQVSESKKQQLFNIGYEEISRAVDRYKKDLSKDKWRKPQNGSTFFNSGYIDYLDDNYAGDTEDDDLFGNLL